MLPIVFLLGKVEKNLLHLRDNAKREVPSSIARIIRVYSSVQVGVVEGEQRPPHHHISVAI
jgi:hypothetical protein